MKKYHRPLKKGIILFVFAGVSLLLWREPLRAQEGASPFGRVIPCVDVKTQREPQTIADTGVERVLSRKILKWDPGIGSWGRVSPRFFGFLLEEQDGYPQEWLVLTIWGAAEWLLLDDQWVLSHSNQHRLQKPLYCSYVPRQWDALSSRYIEASPGWDNFSPLVLGGVITEVYFRETSSFIKIEKDDEIHILEVPADKTLLPPNGGNGEYKIWDPGQSFAAAWVISSSDKLRVQE